MKKCLSVLVMVLTFAVIFSSGCKRKAPADANAVKPEIVTEVAPAAPAAADTVLVTVNGVDIYQSKVEVLIGPQLAQMAAKLPPQFVAQYKKQMMGQALDKMVVEQLLTAKVKAENIVVTDEETNERIKEIASSQNPPLSMEDFKALVEAYGQGFDQMTEQTKRGLGYGKLMESQWAGKIEVNEADANEFYSKNPKQFEVPEMVTASHILIKPADPNTDPNEAKAAAKAKAAGLLEQLKGGADFATLAKENSEGPSGPDGGVLPSFPKGKMVPAFEEAAWGLDVNQVSDIVETQFGYHIIKVAEHNQASVTTFEEAKEDIMAGLKQQKQNEITLQYIEKLKAEAKIVYRDPNMQAPKIPMP